MSQTPSQQPAMQAGSQPGAAQMQQTPNMMLMQQMHPAALQQLSG